MKLYKDQLIVVTGGAGFIGSCVVEELNRMGLDNLVIVDHLGDTDKWKNLRGKRFVDVLEKEQLFSWLEGKEALIEAFVHLGACSSTVERDASYLLQNNYQYSRRLAEYAIKNGHRFVYASSAATYGNGSEGFSDDFDGLEKLVPLNMYGYSKHMFDLWLKSQGLLNSVVGLKYFNVFGPNEYHKGRMASMLFHALPILQKEGHVRLFKSCDPENYPDGGQMRDFIYVKDVAKITCAFLQNDVCGLFNVGTGEPSTWNAVATALCKALDLPPKIHYIDMPKDLVGIYQNYSCAEMERTTSALGSLPLSYTLEEAVIDYVRNYLFKGAYL